MAEDWRVTVVMEAEGHAAQLVAALHAHEIEGEGRARLGERIAVSASGKRVFLYADTEGAAREAEKVVMEILRADGVRGESTLERWHHDEEVWEDASKALPSTPAEKRAEHERLEKQETADSRATGIAEWELRFEFASHHDARAFAERLAGEGFTHLARRWKFLIVGTSDEDDARAWAERLKAELPAGATIHVEPGGGLAWEYMPRNPFAIMGGLGA
jgi:hypothetical protein